MYKTLFFLLLSIVVMGQKDYTVSPHYGHHIILNGKFMQQDVTYNDIVSVVSHFSRVLQDEMNLTEHSVSDKSDNNGNGIYTYVYSERVAFKSPLKKLTFNYKILNYKDNLIVQSVNIAGDYILATKFYVRAFQTTINFKDTKNGILIYNYGPMDDMTFQFKNNLGIITIKNRQIKNLAEFENYRANSEEEYLTRKAEFDKNKAKSDSIYNANEQKKEAVRLVQREVFEKKMAEPQPLPKLSDVVYATKKDSLISINEQYSQNLLTTIKGCLNKEKNGVFSIYFKNINDEKPVCENIRKVK